MSNTIQTTRFLDRPRTDEECVDNIINGVMKEHPGYDRERCREIAEGVHASTYIIVEDMDRGSKYLRSRDTAEVLYVQDLGFDSMVLIEVLASLEKRFNVSISEREFREVPTPASVVAVIYKHKYNT